jgi:hypothetical protein
MIVEKRCPEEAPFFDAVWEAFEQQVVKIGLQQWAETKNREIWEHMTTGLEFARREGRPDLYSLMFDGILTKVVNEVFRGQEEDVDKKRMAAIIEKHGNECGAWESLKRDLVEDLWRVKHTWVRHRRDRELADLLKVAGSERTSAFVVFMNGVRQKAEATQEYISALKEEGWLVWINEQAGELRFRGGAEEPYKKKRFNRGLASHSLLLWLLLHPGRELSYEEVREVAYSPGDAEKRSFRAIGELPYDLFNSTLDGVLDRFYRNDRIAGTVWLSPDVTSCVIIWD